MTLADLYVQGAQFVVVSKNLAWLQPKAAAYAAVLANIGKNMVRF